MQPAINVNYYILIYLLGEAELDIVNAVEHYTSLAQKLIPTINDLDLCKLKTDSLQKE